MLRCCQTSFRTCVGKGVSPPCSASHSTKQAPLRRHSTLKYALTRESLHEYLGGTPANLHFEGKRNAPRQSSAVTRGAQQSREQHSSQGVQPKVNTSRRTWSFGKRSTIPGGGLVQDSRKEIMQKVEKLVSGELSCDARVLDEIMSAYASRQVATLSAKEMDSIISVFGTWCLPETSSRPPYEHPILRGSPLATRELKRYWEFVTQLQEDKHNAGGELSLADEYWRLQKAIYCTLLARTESSARSAVALKELERMYCQARRRFTDDSYHLAFFEIAFLFPSASNRVATLMCEYVQSKQNEPSPQVMLLLWRMILHLGPQTSPELQQLLICVVLSKMTASTLPAAELPVLLADAVFPSSTTPKASKISYVNQLIQDAFHTTIPLSNRWDNLQLLAMNMNPANRATPVKLDKLDSCMPSRTWRTLLFLAYLRGTLKQVSLSTNEIVSLADDLQPVIRTLWDPWVSTLEQASPPRDVDRAVTTTFLEVAGWLIDESQVRQCFQHSRKRNLHSPQDLHDQGSVADLLATYIVSLTRCRAYQWHTTFPHIKALVPQELLDQTLSRAALRLIPHGTDRVRGFNTFLASHNIALPTSVSLKLVTSLVHGREWSAALPLLSDLRFSPSQTEALVVSFLRVFQIQRAETIPSSLAIQLVDTLLRIYTDHEPSAAAKYPVRYFLNIMIAVGQGVKATELVKRIFKHDRTFFTQRVIRRYMMQLVATQNSLEAVRLLLLFQGIFKPAEVADLNRKLSLRLHAAGSTAQTKKALQDFKSPSSRYQTVRERMMRGALLRRHVRPRHAYLQVIHAASRVTPKSPSYIPAMRFAISFLVQHHRMFAARKLYARAWPYLDSKTHALFGNIILHGCYNLGLNRKNLRRHLMHTLTFLRESYGFQPDRATVNIVAKAIIYSCSKRDARPLRALVDEFVRNGYPASDRALGQRTVPFGSRGGSEPVTDWSDIPWPDASKTIVFRKHVQPLYKMFITAFYMRNDAAAAKTVLAMLKDAKCEMRLELEKRNAARREGIVRKKAKLARLAAISNTNATG